MIKRTRPPYRPAVLPVPRPIHPRGPGFAASGPGYYVWQPERIATASWAHELAPTRTAPVRKRPAPSS